MSQELPLPLPSQLLAAWPADRWRDVHVLVAVSAGGDSMALLRAVLQAKQGAGGAGRIIAGHVNHALRPSADDDQTWLARQCEQLGVPLEIRRGDVAGRVAAEGDGVEAAARALRYELLTEMAESHGTRFVATAHTRDDQVETVLFRLLRGAGLQGLRGMRAVRALSPSVALVRPLLECSRAELEAYLASLGQQHRVDPTNADLRFTRNRLRHELIPYLREHYNSDVEGAIGRVAAAACAAQEVIDALATELLSHCRAEVDAGASVRLVVTPLAGQPELIVTEAIRQAWRQAEFAEQAMTHRWWRMLAQLGQATRASGARTLNLPGDIRAAREGDQLVLERRS